MGFRGFIGGIAISIIAVLIGFIGIAVALGFIRSLPSNYDAPIGIILIILAVIMLLYGWYQYQMGKPEGTISVKTR